MSRASRTILSTAAATMLGAGLIVALPAPSTAATPPTITFSLSSQKARTPAGWFRAPVLVAFSCSEGSSPLTAPCPDAVAFDGAGADQFVTRTITNGEGLSATVTVSNIDIDLVGPTVTIQGVKKDKLYNKKKKPKCVAVDDLSGVVSCTLTQTSQKKPGFKKYTVTAVAVDNAAHETMAKVGYKVRTSKKK